jgi:hypothetical protein
MRLDNYLNYFAEAGYAAEVEAARRATASGDDDGVLSAISDAMVDDICVYGTNDDVRAGFDAWVGAGVTHMALTAAGFDLFGSTRSLMDAFDE